VKSTTTAQTNRLVLEPLRVEDASAMIEVLADPDLYEFTGDDPPTFEVLQARYAAQVKGSGRLGEHWLNWIIRLRESRTAVGFIQATVLGDKAEVAWVVGTRWQGQGIASEAASAVAFLLNAAGVGTLLAHIHPGHVASQGVASAIGLERTAELDADGEEVWVTSR
jgi:RimJ/RimL family protein N-acetyltransferase